MKIINKSTRAYMAYETMIKAGEVIEIDENKQKETLKVLLRQIGVEEYIDTAKLADENEQLKKELALANAKAEADKLGIKYAKNIGLDKLQAKITEAKKAE